MVQQEHIDKILAMLPGQAPVQKYHNLMEILGRESRIKNVLLQMELVKRLQEIVNDEGYQPYRSVFMTKLEEEQAKLAELL